MITALYRRGKGVQCLVRAERGKPGGVYPPENNRRSTKRSFWLSRSGGTCATTSARITTSHASRGGEVGQVWLGGLSQRQCKTTRQQRLLGVGHWIARDLRLQLRESNPAMKPQKQMQGGTPPQPHSLASDGLHQVACHRTPNVATHLGSSPCPRLPSSQMLPCRRCPRAR